jgi:small-conductance mechanosensitive channel
MPEPFQPDSAPNASAEHFYSGALDRIRRVMIVLAALLTAAAWWRLGRRAAAGFLVGCVIAYINFHWLKRVISGFADHATGAVPEGSSPSVVSRFLLRYVLMAVGASVILTVSPASLNGLLAGLFLPVAAIVCEAVYEVYAAIARGL